MYPYFLNVCPQTTQKSGVGTNALVHYTVHQCVMGILQPPCVLHVCVGGGGGCGEGGGGEGGRSVLPERTPGTRRQILDNWQGSTHCS